jgi:predicted dehydrogenase
LAGRLGIAIVGAGRAGRARERALGDHPRARCTALVRRASEPSLEQALDDPACDALAVCTPNSTHPGLVEAALARGKHVLVEFPLAGDPDQARGLFAAAAAAGCVLHVEHIELLSPAQVAQRERVGRLGRPSGGALEFSGTSDGWIGDPALAGSPALCAVARLHRLLDLFGDAEVTAATLERGVRAYRLEVQLEFAAGGATTLLEERGSELPRRTSWRVACEQGVLDDPPERPRVGLFLADLDVFLARVLDRAPPYVSDERVIRVLELVRQIERLCG